MTAADAHRDDRIASTTAAELVERAHGELRAGAAPRMSEGDRAAVDVDPIIGGPELRLAVDGLARRGSGPMPMISGSTPTVTKLRNTPSGLMPSSTAFARDIKSAAAAPSEIGDALPAVTLPPWANAGGIFASPSSVVSGRGSSSTRFGCRSRIAWSRRPPRRGELKWRSMSQVRGATRRDTPPAGRTRPCRSASRGRGSRSRRARTSRRRGRRPPGAAGATTREGGARSTRAQREECGPQRRLDLVEGRGRRAARDRERRSWSPRAPCVGDRCQRPDICCMWAPSFKSHHARDRNCWRSIIPRRARSGTAPK